MAKLLKEKIKKIERLAEDIYRITIESEYISSAAVPGQFVNIKCGEGNNAFLRRPLSICSANAAEGTYCVVFKKIGAGTALLSGKKEGDTLDVLGPLGNGFDLDIKYGKIAVVGGGLGIFPLLYVLEKSKAVIKRSYLGFRDSGLMVLEDEFRRNSLSLEITTDDGSYGIKGFITDLLKRDIEVEKFDIIYACGPVPMLKKVARQAGSAEMRCQVSLEQRMGCGFGACLGCAVKMRSKDGGWEYKHVCRDGPVFNGSDVIFE
ncbi:MAG: dihydroorotate dehydrogenase electron transfer subunit [Bacillota bacterium]